MAPACRCNIILLSIYISTTHGYMFATDTSLSAVMIFHTHENFHPWNMSGENLCELCMMSRRERERQASQHNWEQAQSRLKLEPCL